MPELHSVIKRPLVTEKGVTKKDSERTLVLRGRGGRQQNADPASRAGSVQSQSSRTCAPPPPPGKLRRRGRFAGYRSDWKKAYVKLKPGEKMPEYAEI